MLTLLSLLLTPLAGLADPDWPTRERATASLVERGWLALPTTTLGRYSPDPEVRSRSARVQRIQVCLRLQAAELAPGDYPFLDALWYDTATRSYLPPWPDLQERIRVACACTDPAFNGRYGSYRQATRDWMRDGVASGVPVWCFRVVFVEMRRRDAVYLGTVGKGP